MHVAVTGASSGIGAGIAREFAAAGAKVTLVARRKEELERLAGEIGGRAHVEVRDLAKPEEACAWLEPAQAKHGPIDVLVNNAGMQIVGRAWEVDCESGERLLRLNLHTPLRLTRALLPAMLARRSGTIVDVSSMAGLAPTPGMLYYNASKAGLAAASESLRGELRGKGVHVVTVYPGIIDETAMGKKGLESYHASTALSLQPRGTVKELAHLVREAVERRRARVIYPRMNALSRWFPPLTRWLMDRLTPELRAT